MSRVCRFAVVLEWAYSYFAYKRGARITTGLQSEGGPISGLTPSSQRQFESQVVCADGVNTPVEKVRSCVSFALP